MLNTLLALIYGNNLYNIKGSDNPSTIFSALKLVENLYKDGKIEKTVFQNILNQYSDKVDITKFFIGINAVKQFPFGEPL